MDKQYQSCLQDGWQQEQQCQSVTNERAEYAKTLPARKSNTSRQNFHVSEHIASAAEQLLMLASAQTSSFPEPTGLMHCRSNSRDSGLGKDSDSGSSGCSIKAASQPSSFVASTRTPSHDCQYVASLLNPHRPSTHSSSQPLDQPICTVLPMTNYGRHSSHVTVCQSNIVSRYPDSQSARHDAYQYLNRCEMFGGKSPRLALKSTVEPEFNVFGCRDGKQYRGQRFPIGHSVAYYEDVVNPLHHRGSGNFETPGVRQISQARRDVNGWHTTASMSSSNCGRIVDGIPVVEAVSDSALVSERRPTSTCGRTSVFDCGSGQQASSRLVPTEQKDDTYYKRCNMSASHRSAVDLQRDNVDLAHYHAVQQRYRPYDVSVDTRHSNSAAPRGGSRNLFHQTSPRSSVMHWRQNSELFYDSHTSGIR